MDVFVYGTLTEPEQVASVVDSYAFLGSAVLSGLHPVQGEYPTLAPGGETGGRLLRTDDTEALDAYEGVGSGLYVRVPVPVEDVESWDVDRDDEADIDAAAAVYVGDPERLGVGDEVTWPEVDGDSGTFADRVRTYVRRNEVRVRRGNARWPRVVGTPSIDSRRGVTPVNTPRYGTVRPSHDRFHFHHGQDSLIPRDSQRGTARR